MSSCLIHDTCTPSIHKHEAGDRRRSLGRATIVGNNAHLFMTFNRNSCRVGMLAWVKCRPTVAQETMYTEGREKVTRRKLLLAKIQASARRLTLRPNPNPTRKSANFARDKKRVTYTPQQRVTFSLMTVMAETPRYVPSYCSCSPHIKRRGNLVTGREKELITSSQDEHFFVRESVQKR